MNIDAIAKEFGCRVLYSKPLRAVNLTQTDKGLMIIKETCRGPDKILYIHELKEYLFENGFKELDRYLISAYQLPFAVYENRIYIMEKFIEGRECSFTNPYDRKAIIKTLAELHNAGKGYIPPLGAARRNNIGKWTKSYIGKIEDLEEFKKLAGEKRKKGGKVIIPLKDDIPSRSYPIINVLLIAINLAVFFFQLSLGRN
ncbi:MAG TPA: hypothetical protein PLI20_10135, partial [Bacillota bacterium]|nr:hypothetical protein [Bacillota bacterium]